MFERKNTLPRPELHSAIRNRDHFARAREDGANVRSAVVTAFSRVLEVGRVLWDELLEKFLEIASRSWVGVLHDDEAATRMPNEHGDGAGRDAARFERRGDAFSNCLLYTSDAADE